MRVTIIPIDNMVYLDGKALPVDCSSLDKAIHAVQWDGAKGEIEYETIDGKRKPNSVIDSIAPFQPLVDAWNAASAKQTAALAAPPKTTTKAEKPVDVIAD